MPKKEKPPTTTRKAPVLELKPKPTRVSTNPPEKQPIRSPKELKTTPAAATLPKVCKAHRDAYNAILDYVTAHDSEDLNVYQLTYSEGWTRCQRSFAIELKVQGGASLLSYQYAGSGPRVTKLSASCPRIAIDALSKLKVFG